jgi:hypothetical protein
MTPQTSLLAVVAAIAGIYVCSAAQAQTGSQIYLNGSNISVALSDFHDGDPEPFANRSTADSLIGLIDAPSADAGELHGQSTHIWVSGGQLEVVFDFGVEYDLTELHFWNYHSESYDVDDVDLLFFDSEMNSVGTLLDISPALGNSSGSNFDPIFAEDTPLQVQSGVRFVRATFAGTNSQVDFNNIGFTGSVSGADPDVLLGDVNLDGMVDFSDIQAFIAVLISGVFQAEADIDQSGTVDFMDIPGFIEILIGN